MSAIYDQMVKKINSQIVCVHRESKCGNLLIIGEPR